MDLNEAIEKLKNLPEESRRRIIEQIEREEPVLYTAENAPYDDEPLTEEDIAAIEEAKAELARGEGIPMEDVKKEFGF